MADQELRQRRAGKEATDVRKEERAKRIYKIEKKAEPWSWCMIFTIIFFIIFILFIIVDAFSGFRRIKSLFGKS